MKNVPNFIFLHIVICLQKISHILLHFIYFQKDFSVDDFVSNYRKYVSLETMLEDLGLYHKILCSAMVELINKDYADFVNLSSNLVSIIHA